MALIAFQNMSREDICKYFDIDPNEVFHFALERFNEHMNEYRDDNEQVGPSEQILCSVADVYINGILTGICLAEEGKRLPKNHAQNNGSNN